MRRQRKNRYQSIGFNANPFGFCFNDNRDNRDNALNEAAKKTATKALALTPTLRFCFNANLLGFVLTTIETIETML